jgi:mRNA interferase YafQ
MRALRTTRRFERDIKRDRRRGKHLEKLWKVVSALQKGEPLMPRYRAHRLSGDWEDFWECHVEADWLLIWQMTQHELILVRTGTHADLFE